MFVGCNHHGVVGYSSGNLVADLGLLWSIVGDALVPFSTLTPSSPHHTP
jgi:hypothetical protein